MTPTWRAGVAAEKPTLPTSPPQVLHGIANGLPEILADEATRNVSRAWHHAEPGRVGVTRSEATMRAFMVERYARGPECGPGR
ncbi:hypothetical protein [Nonomuraea dietziae]|uniref:hypothetical protein n=1 Tax=Nonomuraea dietziae TaxID=65515 RepID=UPI0031E0E043